MLTDYWKPEPGDPFWMLEAEDGEWLKNEHSLLGTRDATKALRFPTEEAANDHPARMKPGYKWWSAKATEHKWIEHDASADLTGTYLDDENAPILDGRLAALDASLEADLNPASAEARAPVDEVKPLADRLMAGAVWTVSIADHEAEHLTPRQIKKLYEAGDAMREAIAALRPASTAQPNSAPVDEVERVWEPYERNYSGGRFGVWHDGDWTMLRVEAGMADATASIRKHEAWDLALRLSPDLKDHLAFLFTEMKKAQDALYHFTWAETVVPTLRKIADEWECDINCDYYGSSTCHERAEGCRFVEADELRQFATALETRATLRPASTARPDVERIVEDLRSQATDWHEDQAYGRMIADEIGRPFLRPTATDASEGEGK